MVVGRRSAGFLLGFGNGFCNFSGAFAVKLRECIINRPSRGRVPLPGHVLTIHQAKTPPKNKTNCLTVKNWQHNFRIHQREAQKHICSLNWPKLKAGLPCIYQNTDYFLDRFFGHFGQRVRLLVSLHRGSLYDTNPNNALLFKENPSKITIDFSIKFDPVQKMGPI